MLKPAHGDSLIRASPQRSAGTLLDATVAVSGPTLRGESDRRGPLQTFLLRGFGARGSFRTCRQLATQEAVALHSLRATAG